MKTAEIYLGRVMIMRRAIILFALVATAQWAAADQPTLNPHLAMFQPLLEKTWKGALKGSTPEKPIVDIQHWERALNGQAIRVIHSINNGVYGGETMFFWSETNKTVNFYYFTTDGFMTTGTIAADGPRFVASEHVTGDADGVTDVRSTSEMQPDGKFHVKAEYLKNGQWVAGHEATYTEDSASRVLFK
jgi:hypothetical protein